MAIMTLRDELRAAVESRHGRHHPFYQLWAEGKLPREALGGWAQEHYHFTKDVVWLNTSMTIDVPYQDVREMYRRNVEEEMDPREPHIEILLRFAEAMGFDPEEVKRSKPLPTSRSSSRPARPLNTGSRPSVTSMRWAMSTTGPSPFTSRMFGCWRTSSRISAAVSPRPIRAGAF